MTEDRKWYTPGTQEWDFWHEGMTEAEFEEEYQYLAEHLAEWRAGTYVPLWKQRQVTSA